MTRWGLVAIVLAGFFNPRAMHEVLAGPKDAMSVAQFQNVEACEDLLGSLPQHSPPIDLSVYRLFNNYPPVPESQVSSRVADVSVINGLKLPGRCLAIPPFSFETYEGGYRRSSEPSDFKPLYFWRGLNQRYKVIYLYKAYDKNDEDGEHIAMTLVRYDKAGRLESYIEEVSSWYEYEGSIRIHDAKLEGENVSMTQVIYDPEEVDEAGNVLRYSAAPR